MNRTALIGIVIIALIGVTAYAAVQGYIPGYTRVAPTATSSESTTTPPPAPSGDKGVITGKVMVGPTCPGATRVPPDPNCAPHGYQTLVSVYVENGSVRGALITSVRTDASGVFTFSLAPGTYAVEAQGGNPYPLCAAVKNPDTQNVTVRAGQTTSIEISCDNGIR
jgi:hypothetical protein